MLRLLSLGFYDMGLIHSAGLATLVIVYMNWIGHRTGVNEGRRCTCWKLQDHTFSFC